MEAVIIVKGIQIPHSDLNENHKNTIIKTNDKPIKKTVSNFIVSI